MQELPACIQLPVLIYEVLHCATQLMFITVIGLWFVAGNDQLMPFLCNYVSTIPLSVSQMIQNINHNYPSTSLKALAARYSTELAYMDHFAYQNTIPTFITAQITNPQKSYAFLCSEYVDTENVTSKLGVARVVKLFYSRVATLLIL